MDNIENKEIDLADGTFLEKWPIWLRWLAFIPAAIIAPLIFLLVQAFFTTWFLDLGPNAFYLNFLRGVVWGAGFVYVGSIVAPAKQKAIALSLLIVIAMLCGLALFVQINHFVLNEFLEDAITLIAAGATTYYIFKGDEA